MDNETSSAYAGFQCRSSDDQKHQTSAQKFDEAMFKTPTLSQIVMVENKTVAIACSS